MATSSTAGASGAFAAFLAFAALGAAAGATMLSKQIYRHGKREVLRGYAELLSATDKAIKTINDPLKLEAMELDRMVIVDLYDLEIFNNCDHVIDYVNAGPTCTEFSTAFSGPRGVHQRSNSTEPYEPTEGLRLVKRCKEIIDIIQPRYWSIENVPHAFFAFCTCSWE